MKKQYVPASSFWMDDWDDDELYTPSNKNVEKSRDTYRLAAHKRAIANFTSILTGQNIPVRFMTNGGSYTDGKHITISADITEAKEFDVAVGLALHEASHIKLTDFDSLRRIPYTLSDRVPQSLMDKAVRSNIETTSLYKDILNIVEDRRIDNYVFQSSPGYRNYYRMLYDKYFNDTLIDKALQSNEMRHETVESYIFRLMNIHSEHTDITALKKLPLIYQTIDLKNIGRLKSTEDSMNLALEIFQIIIEALDEEVQAQLYESQKNQPKNEAGDDGEQPQLSVQSYQTPNEEDEQEDDEASDETEGESDDTSDSEALDMGEASDESSSDAPSSGSGDVDADKGKATKSLSDKQKDLLGKKIQKQKDFLNGDVKKSKLSQKANKDVEAIAESDSSIEVVGEDWIKGGIQTIIVRKMTRSLMETSSFPLSRYVKTELKEGTDTYMKEHVDRGISLGTVLGKRLQTRGEARETVFNRQKVGKLDKRMVSSLGFGNENVFFSREIDQYKKANLHISIDASGSMGGRKWHNTMVNVVALAKAVDMISNLNIQISFRTTTQISGNELPYVVIAYDSRKDKFSKVKTLFQYLWPDGTTPEGLCFEAMMDEFVSVNTDMDSYFMNISDGEPYFNGYSGEVAATHTFKQMSKLQSMGIQILSYFVSEHVDGVSGRSGRIFKASYGKAASFIDVTNMVEVAKTMNRMFMNKG